MSRCLEGLATIESNLGIGRQLKVKQTMNHLLLLIGFLCSTAVEAFSTSSSTSRAAALALSTGRGRSRRRISHNIATLHMVAADPRLNMPAVTPDVKNLRQMSSTLSKGNQAVLNSLDKGLQKANTKRIKYLAKANKYQRLVDDLEEKKNVLLVEQINGQVVSFSESARRSAIKAMLWRFIAGSVTLFTSLQFSGSLKVALSIVGSDFFSKALTMFIGERLMNKSSAGRDKGADDVGRSLMKALTWRLFAICNTLAAGLLISKDLSVASKIAGSDAIFKTALMFLYERMWARIEWGKEYEVASWKPTRQSLEVTWLMRSKMHSSRIKRRAKELVPSFA